MKDYVIVLLITVCLGVIVLKLDRLEDRIDDFSERVDMSNSYLQKLNDSSLAICP